jgi:hypothetical protein
LQEQDTCGGKILCGNNQGGCPTGQTCTIDGQCITPLTAECVATKTQCDAAFKCGTQKNDCGKDIECGICPVSVCVFCW